MVRLQCFTNHCKGRRCDAHLLLWLVKGECDVLMDSGAAVEELQAAWVREKAQLEQQHQQSQTKVPITATDDHRTIAFTTCMSVPGIRMALHVCLA